MVNRSVFNDKPWDWKIPIATGLAVGMFALGDKALPTVAPMLAWTAVLAVVITRVDPAVPSAAESGLKWFNKISG
jgi:hypothetical protein